MQFREHWNIVWRRKWVVLVPAIVALVVSSYLAVRGPAAYCSNLKLAVSVTPDSREAPNPDYYGPYWQTLTAEYLADDLTELLKSLAFAQDVSAELGYSIPPGVVMNATRAKKTHRTIDLSVCGREAGPVAEVGEAYERALNTRMPEYFRQLQTQNAQIRVLSRPTVSRSAGVGAMAAEIGLRTLLGLALGLALAFLLHYLDDRLRDRHDLERMLGLRTLAEVPKSARRLAQR